MTNIEILLLHHKLYEYLKILHKANPRFLFGFNKSEQGLWFKTTAEKEPMNLHTVLEEGFPNYQLEINYLLDKQHWSCCIKIPTRFRERMASLGFTWKHDRWYKALPSSHDFLEPLKKWIETEKQIIEAGLELQPLSESRLQTFKHRIEFLEGFYKMPHIIEHYRLATERTKSHLPFAVSRLEVIDFQGITHLTIESLPADKPWIFLTGENGLGKTSILKAIAKGLAGDEEFLEYLPSQSHLTINGYSWNQPFYYKALTKQTPNHHFQLATYGVARFQVSKIDPADFSTSKYSKKTYSLFNDDGLLMNIDRFLIDTERDDIPTFQQLKKIFLKIIPNLADLRSEVIRGRRRIRYYEKNDKGGTYAPVYLSELAAGYRGILTLIGDMVQRFAEHPDNSLEDLQGVVLIDEFDAHLHPNYQYELPNLLSEAFPKIQFIVATHSPIPLLGVKANASIVLTVHRTKAAGITVERLDDDIDIQRLSVNALLTSDIFNFGNIFARDATPDA
jgi:predicted ATPase